MTEKPIKRNKHLLLFSREHHFGLLFCWKIRQGLKWKVDTGRIARYVEAFWMASLHPHFKKEEMLFSPALSESLVQKMVEDHSHIQEQIHRIIHTSERVTPQLLNSLTDNVDNHIRFEERILFPRLEKLFSEEELKNIDAHLQSPDSAQVGDTYPDEFWRDARSSL